MKNELLAKLREFFEMHADPLPVCTELPSENDMCERPKRVCCSEGSFENDDDMISFVYAYYFENVVVKGYPLKLITKTLIEHGILIPDEITGKAYMIKEIWSDPEKVYAIQYFALMKKYDIM